MGKAQRIKALRGTSTQNPARVQKSINEGDRQQVGQTTYYGKNPEFVQVKNPETGVVETRKIPGVPWVKVNDLKQVA